MTSGGSVVPRGPAVVAEPGSLRGDKMSAAMLCGCSGPRAATRSTVVSSRCVSAEVLWEDAVSVMREDGAYVVVPATSATLVGLKRGGVRYAGRAGGSRAREAGEVEGPNSSTYKYKKITKKPRRSQRTRRTRSSRITATRCLDGGYVGADMAGGAELGVC